jgi:hypothetical protein
MYQHDTSGEHFGANAVYRRRPEGDSTASEPDEA